MGLSGYVLKFFSRYGKIAGCMNTSPSICLMNFYILTKSSQVIGNVFSFKSFASFCNLSFTVILVTKELPLCVWIRS